MINFDSEKNLFNMEKDGKFIGDTRITPLDKNIISIDSTFVKEEYRGKKLARQLLQAVIDYAHKNDLKIIPICPYARRIFSQEKDIRDVLEDKYLENLLKMENR